MAQPPRPATPSTSDPAVSTTGVTEGLPASVTATSPQVNPGYPDDARTRRGGPGGRGWLILVACALLGTVLGVGAYRVTSGGDEPSAAPEPSPSATAPVEASITPVAAAGSSFKQQKDGSWRSQTYSDPDFGNLKDGIGLILDLGTERPLTAVTFTAETGPMTVELRAGNTKENTGSKLELVGSAVQANGPTSLPATAGGAKRYWMIWVTRLPEDGFQARIADPVARG